MPPFAAKYWRQVRRSAAARAAAAYPNDKALALLAQRGQHGTIYPLRAQNVDIVEFGKLLWCERFSRTEDHVAGIVDNNIQTTVFCENLLDRVLDRFLRRHIHFDPAEITGMFFGERSKICYLRRVAPRGLPHAGVYPIARDG